MKKIVAFICVVLLSVSCFDFVDFGIVLHKEANALSPDYYESPEFGHSINYFFCDSEPSFASSAAQQLPMIVDRHDYLNEQELRFMIFSGYFWGIKGRVGYDYCHVATIQIKTFMPSTNTIENLVACFEEQRVKVIFVTPFANAYGELPCEIIPCAIDPVARYVQNCVKFMEMNNADNSTIILPKEFLNYTDENELFVQQSYVWYRSGALRRLLCYMYYGLDYGVEFEKEVYSQLWDLFLNQYLPTLTSDWGDISFSACDVFDDEDASVNNLFAVWQCLENEHFFTSIINDPYTDFMRNEDLKCAVYDYFLAYYKVLFSGSDEESEHSSFNERKMTFFVHFEDNTFIKLLPDFEFVRIREFNEIPSLVMNTPTEQYSNSIYALGTWELATDYYNFLYKIWREKVAFDKSGSIELSVQLYNLVYEKDPIIYTPGGLPIISDTKLKELVGDEDDNEDLVDYDSLYLDTLMQVINSLTLI